MFTGDWEDTVVVNSAYEEVWDRSVADLIEDPGDFLEGVHPADIDAITDEMERVSSGEPADLEYRVTMDGETRWLSVHAEPVVGDSGDIEYVAGFTRNVDDLKQRELSMGSLNEALTDLLHARDEESVAATVVDVAESVIDCPVTVVRGKEAETGSLVPLAATEAVLDRVGAEDLSELPVLTSGDRLYEIVEGGESRLVEDGDALAETTPVSIDVGSLLVVPLGNYGSLTVGTPPGERLSAYERDLLEVLSRTATAALNRVQRDEELGAYRTELEQSNEDLEQFAYVASHDLQEPLRMVSSYVSLLADEYDGALDAEADEYLEYAVDGADRMREMIDALLDYSRVHTHAEDPESIDASAVLDDALAELALLIDDHGATVDRGELPTVVADPDQLRQVFQNLVKNAVEHGVPEDDDTGGARIAVEATERDDCWEFSVADDGPGVPLDRQDDVFDIFRTGGSGGGTGIGLAVCKRIVERHGGDIWIDSQPGDGTAFRFTLPPEPGGVGERQR
ncbi:sensor histidine kinase [Halomicrobium urmianum]|uniref:sensor histidine kinase n=1 Tax=Halomicrobium urmianum TaxID=1586233 RepID=UPI001CD9DE67|nr:ATP-binding protein [Halomicrobium urmianum]